MDPRHAGPPERVFLLHGMARTPLSMWVMKKRLEGAGYPCSLFGYSVARKDLGEIVEDFVARVRETVEDASSHSLRYAVVGHSLGNVIARLAYPRLPPGWCRFAMLAPPNRVPVMAHALGDNPIYRATTGDTGQKLTDEAFFAALPMPDVPSLIIAGTRGPRAAWLPFGGEPNDAILKVAETELEGVPTIEVAGIHTFLMNRRDVFAAIREFFAGGAPPAW
jgi:alpha-beta hydrolase superfamily lysophospholipase